MPDSRRHPRRGPRQPSTATPRVPRRPQAQSSSPCCFADFLLHQAASTADPGDAVEPLAHLDYPGELALKNEALRAFWQGHCLPGAPADIQASPRPRHYRTTTRRRALFAGNQLRLGFDAGGSGRSALLPDSALEPQAHTAIYRFIVEQGSQPVNRPVAQHLNHLVVRGSYESFSVIFNMDRLDRQIVRRLKVLGEQLQTGPEPVVSAFVFHDPSRSDYYFELAPPPVPVRLKKLFGPDRFLLHFGPGRYLLHPTSFSQVNESMVLPMLARVSELLRPGGTEQLLDLYCGYGLFSHFLSPDCAAVYGVDANRESIQAAIDSARYHAARGQVSFSARPITAPFLDQLRPAAGNELAILDPPRQGTDPQVIAALAARRPRRIAHIFCGTDEIPPAVRTWTASGYRLTQCIPLDMFPGTPNLETLLLFEPTSSCHAQPGR